MSRQTVIGIIIVGGWWCAGMWVFLGWVKTWVVGVVGIDNG